MQKVWTPNLWTWPRGSPLKNNKHQFAVYHQHKRGFGGCINRVFGFTNSYKKLRVAKGKSLRLELYLSWSQEHCRLLQQEPHERKRHPCLKVHSPHWHLQDDPVDYQCHFSRIKSRQVRRSQQPRVFGWRNCCQRSHETRQSHLGKYGEQGHHSPR